MSQYTEGQRKSFKSGSTAGAHLRWKLSDAATSPPTVALAGASDPSICINEDPVLVSGDDFAGRLSNAQGTRKMVASEAITGGNVVYAAASGKVASTGTVIEGTALESAGANNDIIEVIPIHNNDVSSSISGTTAATFEADSDLGKPRAALGSQTGGTGDFKAVIRPPSTLGADRVFTLVGDAAANIVNEATAQTLTNKTLTSPVITTPTQTISVEAVAAAGSAQGDATAATAVAPALLHGTGADGTKGIKLPAAAAGKVYYVKNSDAANAVLKVYPASGDAINALSADTAISMAAKTAAVFVALDATTWYTFSLLPS